MSAPLMKMNLGVAPDWSPMSSGPKVIRPKTNCVNPSTTTT